MPANAIFRVPLTSNAVTIDNTTTTTVFIPLDYTYLQAAHYYIQVFIIAPCFYLSLVNVISVFFSKKLNWKSAKLNWLIVLPIILDPFRILLDIILFDENYSATPLFFSRCFRIINGILISIYLVNRALLVMNIGFVRAWRTPLRYGYTTIVTIYGLIYFTITVVQYVKPAFINVIWFNPFRTVFFVIICFGNISCDLFFLYTLSQCLTFKNNISASGMFVYLIPCGFLIFYIVEKLLLQIGYVAAPGSSTAIDEYNNIAFLAFTWELFLIQNVQESINKSLSSNSDSRGIDAGAGTKRAETSILNTNGARKLNEDFMLEVMSPLGSQGLQKNKSG
ncbi:hypothetical protein HK096_003957, partial [Nowakowskiella sp. JEL0078]